MKFLKEFVYKFKLFISFFILFYYDSSITLFLNSKPLDISTSIIGYNSFFETDNLLLIKKCSIEHFFPLHNEVNSTFTIKNEYFLYILVSTFLSVTFCYPLFLYELYLFLLPALFNHEKIFFINFFFFSTFINFSLFFFFKT